MKCDCIWTVSTDGDCSLELTMTTQHIEQGTVCYAGGSYSKMKQIYFPITLDFQTNILCPLSFS